MLAGGESGRRRAKDRGGKTGFGVRGGRVVFVRLFVDLGWVSTDDCGGCADRFPGLHSVMYDRDVDRAVRSVDGFRGHGVCYRRLAPWQISSIRSSLCVAPSCSVCPLNEMTASRVAYRPKLPSSFRHGSVRPCPSSFISRPSSLISPSIGTFPRYFGSIRSIVLILSNPSGDFPSSSSSPSRPFPVDSLSSVFVFYGVPEPTTNPLGRVRRLTLAEKVCLINLLLRESKRASVPTMFCRAF